MPLVTVGNHSYTHAYNHYRYFYSSVEGLLAERGAVFAGIRMNSDHEHCGWHLFLSQNVQDVRRSV